MYGWRFDGITIKGRSPVPPGNCSGLDKFVRIEGVESFKLDI